MTVAQPPPPTAAASHVAFYDTECFPNYWLLKLHPRGGPTYSFRLRDGQTFDQVTVNRIKLLFSAYTTVSFNGLGYDISMLIAATIGHTPLQLKQLSDRIIIGKMRPWQLDLPEWAPTDHIDIMEVAPGSGSQKQYAGRIHCKTMRDLPYEPDRYLTENEIVEVDTYCENDLDNLEEIFDALRPQIELREKMSKRYGIDLRSKSDAQVAEAVLKRRCEQALGHRIFKPYIDWNMQFKYKVQAHIAYNLPQLQHALELVRESVFRLGASGRIDMPHQLEQLEITINRSTYKMGIGGLHSQEQKLVATSGPNNQLRMPDVASYYPSLILNSGEWPSALGPAFLAEYSVIKDERLAAKSHH